MVSRFSLNKVDEIWVAIQELLHHTRSGEYRGRFGAEGNEIYRIREYEFGDTIDKVDWFNSGFDGGRTTMVIDRTPKVSAQFVAVVDLTPSMNYGTVKDLSQKSNVARDLVETFAHIGSKNGNLFGAVIAGRSASEVLPYQGLDHVEYAMDQVDGMRLPDESISEFVDALNSDREIYDMPTVVVVMSDFLLDGWETALSDLSIDRGHTVFAVRVIDPREEKLENVGIVPFCDPVSGAVFPVDTSKKSVRDAYSKAAEAKSTKIKDSILESGAEYFELRTDGDWLEDFIQKLHDRNQEHPQGRRVA